MTFFERVPPPTEVRKPFDVVLVQERDDDPLWDWEGRTALLIAGSGVFVLVRRPAYSYARPATLDDLQRALGATGSDLLRGKHGIFPKLEKRLPWALIAQARAFFLEAWRAYQTEDVLLVYYWLKCQEYTLEHPPLRYATENEVGYDFPPTPVGAIIFGTIHSHPEMTAFHSGLDRADAVNHPGFHLVLGGVEKRVPSIACTFSDGAKSYSVDPADLFEEVPVPTFPPEWLTRPPQVPSRPPVTLPVKKGEPI